MAHASLRFTKAERKSATGPGSKYWTVSFLAEYEGHPSYSGQAAIFLPGGVGDFLGAIPLPPPVLPRWLRSETLSEHLYLYFFNQVQAALTAADGSLRPLLGVTKEAGVEFDVVDEHWLHVGESAGPQQRGHSWQARASWNRHERVSQL
ncbi:MAG TPA: hypothetical protein VMS88_01515 [Terriglobales bacterium]|nr:hypothetical protein [Terriglobales bacterium]